MPAPHFRDADLPQDARIDDVISRLSISDKIGQLMMSSPAVPELGIAAFDWWNEALHGVARNGAATVFPQAIALAATWNPELHQRIAEAISTEARAKHNALVARTGGASKRYEGLTLWSPNINLFRDPRWGRGQETYGEDPFLTSRLAVAFVHGLQGADPRYLKTVATLKHFAVHSGPEESRHSFNAIVSERDLYESYLPAFEAGIREGGARSVMSAYNAVGGVPVAANFRLLTQILRGDWGFTGAVVGDVDSVADVWKPESHHFVSDAAEASALALRAGNDLCSGDTYRALGDALGRGLVTEAYIDEALRRLLRLRFDLGLFDPPNRVPYTAIPPLEAHIVAHDELALEVALQSLVLLKNDGTLPLNPRAIRTLAVIGPTADSLSAMLGNYSGTPLKPRTLLSSLKSRLEPLGIRVLFDAGAPLATDFREECQPFASGVLFADAERRQPGLAACVFDNPNLQGEPIALRFDERVDFKWNSYEPMPDVPIEQASASWSGWLVSPATGEAVITLILSGGARLFIDGANVIDAWGDGALRSMSAPCALVAGRGVSVRLEYTQGKGGARITLGWKPPGGGGDLASALAVARLADCVVLALGLTPELEGEEMPLNVPGFRGGDRTSVLLPSPQAALLEAASSLGKPLVVVLTTGSAVSFDVSKANAALVVWYYGQRGGDAVGRTLFGDANPAGRLPVTFYATDADLPPFEDYSMARRTYRYFTGKPLFAFGHGLSYTTFVYESMSVRTQSIGSEETRPEDGALEVRVRLRNTGNRAGDEVVQLYVTAEKPRVPMPLQTLVGFQRVALQPGESKTVAMNVPIRRMRRWDCVTRRYVVDPGVFELRAGSASDKILLSVQHVFP